MAETGHARNIERFATMISFVQGYGVTYNSANAAISVVNLQANLADANTALDGVTSALALWKVVVNERQNAFDFLQTPINTGSNTINIGLSTCADGPKTATDCFQTRSDCV